MPDFITLTLKCLNCGAALQITPDMNRFACGYCGMEQLIERAGGTVALKAVSDAIARVQVGTDKTAAELAFRRLKEEQEEVKRQETGIHINARRGLKNAENSFGCTVIIGVIIALCFGVQTSGLWFALAMIASAIFLGWYYYNSQAKPIQAAYEKDLEHIRHRQAEIQAKIDAQKAILDS